MLLIKEIGTDALFASCGAATAGEHGGDERRGLPPPVPGRQDLAVAVAQTDVKGDRASRPRPGRSRPVPPRRVCDGRWDRRARREDAHVGGRNADEIIVLPSRSNGSRRRRLRDLPVPVDTPGLTLYTSTTRRGPETRSIPAASRSKMLDTLTVFDDVLVPWDRRVPRPPTRRSPARSPSRSSSTTGSPRSATSCRCSTSFVGARARGGRGERQRPGGPRPRQAHPAGRATRRPCAAWRSSAARGPRGQRGIWLPHTAHHEHGEVHVRAGLPRRRRDGRTCRVGCSHRAGGDDWAVRRCGPC